MTHKAAYKIILYKNIALTQYLNFCTRHSEVPRVELVLLVNGCENIEVLEKAIKKFKR